MSEKVTQCFTLWWGDKWPTLIFCSPASPPQCRDSLTVRQKLISQDYRVSYSLAKACKLDLRKQRCSLDTNLPRAREARLSYLLLCLENAVHRGESGEGVSCQANHFV